MLVSVVDSNGYILINCIEKEKTTDENICVKPLNNYSLVKPKWNFEKEEWIEGATQEEIQEWEEKNKPKPKEPTETEILQKQLLETQNLVLELQYKLTNKDLEIK
ncbi:hypothetical protein HYH38_07940 [Clostridium botulinum]|uniref:hypothetical protein n=1 Tax=Clostridium TaxID=1485 RepID=UPI000174E543|nr:MULTISPECIES: hypothetical protein [Clostridium]ACD54095.1 hypothetical protein CLH_2104 [Clostridium botulinum E3 str. Alaska E43]MBY6816534.1 hypothetical protein [Clostridium botulinum]MBY6827211.1 hypothetical protein [Clostridium botulinum]MBY6859159.1 hypothetical protein [Clostridium botulinum]MBY7041557.1 hypothetical protein [Clostridium botulinum]